MIMKDTYPFWLDQGLGPNLVDSVFAQHRSLTTVGGTDELWIIYIYYIYIYLTWLKLNQEILRTFRRVDKRNMKVLPTLLVYTNGFILRHREDTPPGFPLLTGPKVISSPLLSVTPI